VSFVGIACDESGYEGEKLVGGVTDVFAHASVVLDESAAAECVAELRRRIRSPATEYKANHVLRSKNRQVLLWLLGQSGPLLGNAQVQLVDKAFFLVSRLTEMLVGRAANSLYAAGRSTGGSSWDTFLQAANNLMWARETPDAIDAFFKSLEQLPFDGEVVAALKQARPSAEAFRAGLITDPTAIPPLDPLLPAIARAVEYWADGQYQVAIAHDRQTSLSPQRIQRLGLGDRLARLELVDSFSHPRVQVADFLAGVARKIASDQLAGDDDAELTALIRPYLDPRSVWGDDRSWARLRPDRGSGLGNCP
jgi:hypothetical protein